MEQTVISAISSLGFPIVCCLIVLYMYWKSDQTHKAEVDKLSEAVQNNTVVMEKILTHLEMKGDSSSESE
nr:MAG TPA: YvrJ protein family protein [Caudoviricetes sp.]